MDVTFRTQTLRLNVEASDTIKDVKYRIEKEKNIPIGNQRLSLNDERLEDEVSLDQLGGQGTLCLALDASRRRLFLQSSSTDSLAHYVWPSDNVFTVKQVIAKAEGRNPSDFLLLYERKALRDEQLIRDLGASPASSIRLVERSHGFFALVWNVDDNAAFCVGIEASAKVGELKYV